MVQEELMISFSAGEEVIILASVVWALEKSTGPLPSRHGGPYSFPAEPPNILN